METNQNKDIDIKRFRETFQRELGILDADMELIESWIKSNMVSKAEMRGFLDDIENALFTGDSLKDKDVKRGIFALKYPEVLEIYQSDLNERLEKWQKVKNMWLSKLNEN